MKEHSGYPGIESYGVIGNCQTCALIQREGSIDFMSFPEYDSHSVFAALLVGMINVAVEPLYGAVAAKVLVMVLIIAVIQVRPEGIFTMKVRK